MFRCNYCSLPVLITDLWLKPISNQAMPLDSTSQKSYTAHDSLSVSLSHYFCEALFFLLLVPICFYSIYTIDFSLITKILWLHDLYSKPKSQISQVGKDSGFQFWFLKTKSHLYIQKQSSELGPLPERNSKK